MPRRFRVRGTVYKLGTAYDSEHERCPACRGTGTVSDGRAARAELIRVQCELSRTPTLESDYQLCPACDGDGLSDPPPNHRRCRSCDGTGKRDHKTYKCARALLKRERELLTEDRRREWAGQHEDLLGWDNCTWHFRRGFVERIEVPDLEWVFEWREVDCPRCKGKGTVFKPSDCPDCDGEGAIGFEWAVTPWALAVAAAHPVTEFGIGDIDQYTIASLPEPIYKAGLAIDSVTGNPTEFAGIVALAAADVVRAAVLEAWAKEGHEVMP